jgi:hypothetical protein
LAIALVLAGCAAPGASRLQGPPKDLPPSLSYVTADVLGFTLYDTTSKQMPDSWFEAIGMTTDDAQPWVGDHAGVAVRQLDVSDTGPDTTALFTDVASRSKLETALENAGWEQSNDDLPDVNGEEAALWTHDPGCSDVPDGARAICAPSTLAGTALAVFGDALLLAPDQDGLTAFLKAADSYAVPERKAMREYAVDVVHKVPVGAVFRTDLLRTGVRRPFQDNPALLELARWATESNVLVAARDGWIGIAPAGDPKRKGEARRLIGAFEWVPDLAPDIDWGEADRDMLDSFGPGADLAIAFENPGQHLHEIVSGITRRNGQYATDQDVKDDEREVELEPLLEELDGDAAIARSQRSKRLELRVAGAAAAADDVKAAIRRTSLDATVTTAGDDLSIVVGPSEVSEYLLGVARAADTMRAGRPPSPPIMWIWSKSIAGCTGPAAGWVSFDEIGEMTFSIDVTGPDRNTPPFADGACSDVLLPTL